MRNLSPPTSKEPPNSAAVILEHCEGLKGLRGGESSNILRAGSDGDVDRAGGVGTEVSESEAATAGPDWLPRHSAYMDLRVRAAKRKTYEEVNEEDDGLDALSVDAEEADADSDWNERRVSKRVTKKRERYSPGGGEKQRAAGPSKPKLAKVAKIVVLPIPPCEEELDLPKPKSSSSVSKRRKTSSSSYRRRPAWMRPRGIDNPDLTCYANSVIQAIFCNDSVKEFLMNLPESEKLYEALNGEMGNVLIIDEFRKIMRALTRHTTAEPSQPVMPVITSVSVANLMTEVRKLMPEFKNNSHHDSHEFFIKTTQRMHDELLKLSKMSNVLVDSNVDLDFKLRHSKLALPSSNPASTMISAYFMGTLETSQVCEQCGAVTTTDDVLYDLGLPILTSMNVPFESIDECIATYFSHDSQKHECLSCTAQCNAVKTTLFKIPPMILCVQLRRYNNAGYKIDTRLKFPLEGMDLSDYVKVPSRLEELAEDSSSNDSGYGGFGAARSSRKHQPYVYNLFSIICHRGIGIRHGHYLSYGKTGGEWYCFNDARVRLSSESEVMRQKPYILFYRREF
ncbi:hypothetical protein L596_010387 [Steinernema carpocapsae]|uniref:ubiquitinyl hydrolase 1 n=1 Tax=Steinernema carpocapsae TaxID=34508 RepID=A0A4U5PIR0_STECR|nr:hypothetical protein L596_010387 [Steinernema carpocapsae]